MRAREKLIPEVFAPTTGIYIQANTFFSNIDDKGVDDIHTLRRELRSAKRNGTKLLVCALCQEPIFIAGGIGSAKRQYHFKHFRNNPLCPYQGTKNLPPEMIRRIKYNGAKESHLHLQIKENLHRLLSLDPEVSEVRIEKTFFHQDGGKEWRRPDISFCWRGKQIVFEIQISSDFLDVIVGREEFYRSQEVFIFWIFNRLDKNRFTSRDIYVGNQKNVFVFDETLQEACFEGKRLLLECHYKEPRLTNGTILDTWNCRKVTLDELTFDQENIQAYWFAYYQQEKLFRRQQLKEEFENYWCGKRLGMEETQRLSMDHRYVDEFHLEFGVPKEHERSCLPKFLYALYSLRDGKVYGYDLENLFSLVDVMLNQYKQFTYVLLWALATYGHRDSFKDRPAFSAKVENYKANLTAEKYKRDAMFDKLYSFLFPELQQKLQQGGS